MAGAELAIRMARAAFNRALEEGDLAAIRPILAPKCLLVTGTDSAVLSGRQAQLAAWKGEFAAARRTTYVRTPDQITPSAVEPIAMEVGHWQGIRNGQCEAHGTYSAKWREVGGHWVIEAEMFVTLG